MSISITEIKKLSKKEKIGEIWDTIDTPPNSYTEEYANAGF